MTVPARPLTGTAAGVPYVALAPRADVAATAPVVVGWHLLDPPRTEAALAAALPLDGLDAWRVYLGLPMTGTRLPAGGWDELVRLAMDDAVLRLHGPIASQAVAEFPAALAALREQFPLADGPIGVLGGSLGSAVAQQVILDSGIDVAAAVLVSPVCRFRPMVDALSAQFGSAYDWSPRADDIARQLDFVARADEFVDRGQPAVLTVVGAEDDEVAFLGPASELAEALSRRYADPLRVEHAVIPAMGHALAEEPGVEPAPQTPSAVEVGRLATAWLRAHLLGS